MIASQSRRTSEKMRYFPWVLAFSLALLVLLAAPTRAQDAVVFSVGESTLDEDGVVTVPIYVEGFEDVTGAQFSLQWDPALLQFKDTRAYALPGMGGASFGTPANPNIDEGTLTFAWDDPDAVGKTVADGSTLFEVTFTTIGSTEVAEITFSDEPTPQGVYVGFTEATFVAVNGDAVLPVELTAFTAQVNGRDVVLRWETQSEYQNAGFEVAYRPAPKTPPADAVEPGRRPYKQLGFEPGQGTTQTPQQYIYRVKQLPPGAYQFRLTQVDTDGTESHGPTVEAQVALASSYELTPPTRNPFHTQTQFRLTVRQAQHVTAIAYNALGQRVGTLYQGELPASTPAMIAFDGTRLPSGAYWIRVRGDGFTAVRSVVLTK